MASQFSRIILKLTLFLACADAVSVTDIFPTSSTTNLKVMCKAGFTIGGGVDDAARVAAWPTLAACRMHCECVAVDGSCKYCCKKTASTCTRHLPLYQYDASGDGLCLTCDADEWLHEAGISGSIGTSAVDSTQWVHRGSNWIHDMIRNTDGIRFTYYSDFAACWSTDGGGHSAQAAACTAFGAETTGIAAETGSATDFVTPQLSPVLNQGGCGSCYIQAATSTLTDRALLKMTSTEQTAWKDASKSYSTGQGTRCHWAAGSGHNSCDGGNVANVMKTLSTAPGNTIAPNMPSAPFGASTCTGGVYGGPGTNSPYAQDHADYYAKWAYGCNSGCTPYHAGFDGPVVPEGATCPTDYTDDAAMMQAGFFTDGSPPTGSNFNQYSVACGCGGTLTNSGPCTYCGAFQTSSGSLYPFGKWVTIALADCTYAKVAAAMQNTYNWDIGAESDWSGFAMTGDAVMALSVSQGSKDYMITQLSCTVTPAVDFGSTTQCTKCCQPRPAKPAGYQYLAKAKAAQAPATCSGAGVTAGSTPGAAPCTAGACTGTCDSTGTYPADVVFDNSANNVYNPIGMMADDAGYNTWHPMFEHFIKDEIAQHGPVSAGFTVPGNFGTFFAANPTGIMTMQTTDAVTLTGGHAVSIVGWGVDAGQKYWLVRNSWGRRWADSGFFRVEIGGGVAALTHFGARSISAMSAVLQTGSFRRLDSDGSTKSRRLAAVTRNQTTMTDDTHGGHEACTVHHKADVDSLRTWFLANASNYKGVSPECAVPWEHESDGACTAQVINGLHIKLTLHVKDCNATRYHMVTRMAHDGASMDTAQVLANSGPEVTQADEADPSNAAPPATTTVTPGSAGAASTTSSAWRAATSFVATLFVVAQMLQ